MDRYVVGEWLARIQFVNAMLVFGWLVLDISLPSSRYQASLGVSQSGTFMGGVVDLLDDGLQVGVRQAVCVQLVVAGLVTMIFRVGAGAVLLDSSLIPSPPIMPQDRARVDDP